MSPSAPGRRVRVLQVTHDLGVGGLPRVVVTLATSLDPSRYDVSVLCMRGRGALAEDLERAGIPIFDLAPPRQPDRLAAWRTLQHLRRLRPDILHTHNSQPFLEAGLAGLLARVPAFIHTDHGREFPDRRRYMLAERVMSRFADRVVGVSEQTARDLVHWEKMRPERVIAIENGIDGGPFAHAPDVGEARRSLGLSETVPVIGAVSRFQPEKGIDLLIEALPRVIEAVPGACCVLAGYGDEEALLRGRARELGLEDRVRFLGSRRDIPVILAAMDVFFLPSRREGLPMALLEALAAGRPIVAARVGGIPGVLEEGRTGTLVPPESPSDLADGIIALLADPARRRDYAEAGRRLFQGRFSAEAMTSRYEALYEEALG